MDLLSRKEGSNKDKRVNLRLVHGLKTYQGLKGKPSQIQTL